MTFSLCPDDSPPRLLRFGWLPYPNMLSIYDKTKNLLLVDKDHWSMLPIFAQRLLELTTAPFTYIQHNPEHAPGVITGEYPQPIAAE